MWWKSLGGWCQKDSTQDSAVRSALQSWNSAQHTYSSNRPLVGLSSSSCFKHHIRNSQAVTIHLFSHHHFHHLACECFFVVYEDSYWRNLCEEMLLTVSVSTARMSKFSHLLRLADNFWWCFVTIRVRQSYLRLVNASETVFSVFSSASPCFFSFSLLFQEAYHS